jgi:hypothetical protein
MSQTPDFPFFQKPSGEDFFLWYVIIDTPNDPHWNDGFVLFGSWDSTVSQLQMRLGLLVDKKAPGNLRIEMFQGQNARNVLPDLIREESFYRQFQRDMSKN